MKADKFSPSKDPLFSLRAKINLTEKEQAVINGIYNHYRDNNQWAGVRKLQIQFGKESMLSMEERHPPRLIQRYNEHGREVYKLSAAGLLLSENAEDDIQLVCRYLDFVKNTVKSDPEFDVFKSQEVNEKLELSNKDSTRLREIILITGLWGGGFYNEHQWETRPPHDVIDLIESHTELDYLVNKIEKEIPRPQKQPGELHSQLSSIKRIFGDFWHLTRGQIIVRVVLFPLGLLFTTFLLIMYETTNPLDVYKQIIGNSWTVQIFPATVGGSIEFKKNSRGRDSLVAWADSYVHLRLRVTNNISRKLRIDSIKVIGKENRILEYQIAGLRGLYEIKPGDLILIDENSNADFKLSAMQIKENGDLLTSLENDMLRVVFYTDRGSLDTSVKEYVFLDNEEKILKKITRD